MSDKTIGVGDIIKDFNEKLEKERKEVKRLREEVYNLTRANDTAWALLEVAGEEE